MAKWLRRAALGAGAVLALLVAGLLVASRFSDGPIGPLGGGRLRAGELVTDAKVDWTAAGPREVELELVATGRSRLTGSLVYEDQLYIPCDLGFIWRRIPSAGFRAVARVLWTVKHWHEDAVADGRAVVRFGGKRYERQAVRVTDPGLLARLRAIMEEKAAQYMKVKLEDVPGDTDAIWFFRLDPRPG
jgi:hypothetical protein